MHNSTYPKVPIACPPDTFLTKEGQVAVHQPSILRIYPSAIWAVKIVTFAKFQTVGGNFGTEVNKK